MPTIREAIQEAVPVLEAAGVESARLNAELLLAHVLSVSRMRMLLDSGSVLPPAAATAFGGLVERRAKRIPLQHLTGTAGFLDLEFEVNGDVLVPRPETEGLVQHALACAAATPEGVRRILDFGTGSGCIAISLASSLPEVEFHAVDLSPAALAVARRNAQRNGVEGRIRFHQGDGFHALGRKAGDGAPLFGMIVSNPPYIPRAEIASLDPEVRDHDPVSALDGGADGLDFYRILASEGAEWLAMGGWLLAEFGDGQGPAVAGLFAAAGNWSATRVEKDLSGRERLLIVRRGTGFANTGPA